MSLLNNPYYLQTCHNLLLSGFTAHKSLTFVDTNALYRYFVLCCAFGISSKQQIVQINSHNSCIKQISIHVTLDKSWNNKYWTWGTMKDHHTGKRIKTEQRPVVITYTSKRSNGCLTFNQGKHSETWPSDSLYWMSIPVL